MHGRLIGPGYLFVLSRHQFINLQALCELSRLEAVRSADRNFAPSARCFATSQFIGNKLYVFSGRLLCG
jgi:hypothetical protein